MNFKNLLIVAASLMNGGLLAQTIVDNTDPGFSQLSGSWVASTNALPFQGANYLHNGSAGAGAVEWNLNLTGTYQVYIQYSPGANRTAAAVYTVHHAGGSSAFPIDQRTGGGWVGLGAFDNPSRVSLDATGTTGYVIADAVKAERVGGGGSAYIPAFAFSVPGNGSVVNTYLSISNVTDQPVTVTITLRNYNGSVLGSSQAALNTYYGVTNPVDGGSQNPPYTLRFELAPWGTGQLSSSSPTLILGWGLIEWSQASGDHSEAVVAWGQAFGAYLDYRSAAAITINGGKPF